jgi:hypothetical protein
MPDARRARSQHRVPGVAPPPFAHSSSATMRGHSPASSGWVDVEGGCGSCRPWGSDTPLEDAPPARAAPPRVAPAPRSPRGGRGVRGRLVSPAPRTQNGTQARGVEAVRGDRESQDPPWQRARPIRRRALARRRAGVARGRRVGHPCWTCSTSSASGAGHGRPEGNEFDVVADSGHPLP